VGRDGRNILADQAKTRYRKHLEIVNFKGSFDEGYCDDGVDPLRKSAILRLNQMNINSSFVSGFVTGFVSHLTGAVLLTAAGFAMATVSPDPPEDSLHPADMENRSRNHFAYDKAFLLGGAEGDAAISSSNYDVQHYLLDLTIDPSAETIAGFMRMVFSSLGDENTPDEHLHDVVLDLTTDLTVDSVIVHSASVVFTHADDSLVIHLDTPLARNDVDSVKVFYSGSPQPRNNDAGLTFKIHHDYFGQPEENKGQIIASLSEPAFAKYWWPCKDRPDDKALAMVRLTVPDTLVAISNGILRAEIDSDPGWKTYVWEETYPIASYLISVAISDYELLADDSCVLPLSGYVPLRNWIFPPDVIKAEADLVSLCDMIEFMEGIAGAYPFPGEKYGHATFVWGGAMEHQTVTSFGSGLFTGTGRFLHIIVHELAHQWFGDSLTPRYWADIWLNEGFATYCEALWVEHTEGREAYLENMRDRRHSRDWEGLGHVRDPMPIFPGRIIYDKGAWILHMLRGRMGDEEFGQFFLDYATGSSRALSTVTTDEFIDLAEQYANEPLQEFFHPWLNTDEVPLIQFHYGISDGDNGPGTHLELEMTQTQHSLFDNVYPVHVTTTGGDTILSLPLATWQASYAFDLLAEVTTVELDPEWWVLWQQSTVAPPPQGLTLIYPNPAGIGNISFAFRINDPVVVTLRIYDVRGRLMAEIQGAETPLIWNGFTNSGKSVASGVYWAELLYQSERSVKKFTIVH